MPTSYCCCCSKRPLGEQGPTGTVSKGGAICRQRVAASSACDRGHANAHPNPAYFLLHHRFMLPL